MSEREDVVIGAAARALRARVELDPSLDERIMAAVRAELPRPALGGRRGPRAAWRWLSSPRTVRVSPLAGLAIAAGLAAIIALAATRQAATPPPAVLPAPDMLPVAVAGEAAPVQFVLVAPGASSVALVGDFNGWDAAATPLHVVASGDIWMVEIPLPPGRHQYAFIVDGTRWTADPSAPRAVADDFGTPNSVVTVAERSS